MTETKPKSYNQIVTEAKHDFEDEIKNVGEES